MLWGGLYTVNDYFEYDNDGIPRKITGKTATHVDFTPALPESSVGNRIIHYWGSESTNMTEDWRIKSGSKCIDAADGNNDPEKDIEGLDRKDDTTVTDTGTGTPTFVDIGAHEYQP